MKGTLHIESLADARYFAHPDRPDPEARRVYLDGVPSGWLMPAQLEVHPKTRREYERRIRFGIPGVPDWYLELRAREGRVAYLIPRGVTP